MKHPDHQRHRLAGYILQQVERRGRLEFEAVCGRLPDIRETFTQLQAAARRLDYCGRRGWRLAAQSQLSAVWQLAGEMASRITELQGISRTSSHDPPAPVSLREVHGELAQLLEEFDQVAIDHRGRTVTVTIEPVTLHDIYLGAFEIELDLSSLSRHPPAYKVVALDPNPASSNENVTHPHVRDEELCEGEAAAGIRSALATGRLCDFFMLVRSVLQTYNASSPYVALESWGGVACHDCGHVADEDSSHYCEGCDHDFCEDCISYCRQCDDSRCRGCLTECSACGELVCKGCRNICEGCGKVVCDGCIEDELCPDCREKEEEQDGTDEGVTDATPSVSGPAPRVYESKRRRRRQRHRRIAA